ncbi:alpha/beta-Hydrolases superfamily protein [Zea mays]|uniref:Alpha/beta-Hydrolases superfamily protein n=1 Tax=Zea mays TaxID=4577 RepID=A0A1D6JQW8_MAIZE|nr:alpha/beta-Hydrolases superfamily protein [Zea mays]
MLRRVLLLRHFQHHRHRLRLLSTTPTPHASPSTSASSLPIAATPAAPHHLAPHRGGARRLAPLLAFSSLSLAAAGAVYLTTDNLEDTLQRSRDSAGRVVERMQHTWTAARVLWKSLLSVLSSANHEVRSGFELRVAALLADIAAASAARRTAIVSAGGGAVLDWLLESVVRGATQAEAARALAHLLADPWVAPAVLGRPHAVPCLLHFIFSFQPTRGKKKSSFDGLDHSKGRSMLVAALMDIITSNCDNADYSSFKPLLPADADTRDIATAIEVIEQGGMHFDDHEDNSSNDGDSGLKGIGIKVLGGTTVLGFSRGNNSLELDNSDYDTMDVSYDSSRSVVEQSTAESPLLRKLSSSAVPGLWDDLQREHVAVPFATWALANWAIASDLNRTLVQELDSDGHAVATALKAAERTVKWHGTLVARALLEDQNLALAPSVPDWCSSLLSTASQATANDDMPLGQLSLSTFLLSMMRCNESKFVIRQKGLHPLRSIAKKIENQNGQNSMKESIASALSLLYAGEVPLSLEESQRWSGILLRWLFDKSVSNKTHLTAMKILSCILEDYGPASVPISQGWLALVLSEILGDNKAQGSKGTTQPEPEKVKNPVDYHNASTATQVLNQLGSAVVKLASTQSNCEPGSDDKDKGPLSDFLSLEPFATVLKNMNKKNLPKFDAADSASATLKGIKALAELCSEDGACQKRIADLGALPLLRHILLGDDYEKLAAIEAYDASRTREVQDKNVAPNVSSTDATTDPSSVRVPPAAHIRRHAGRLLTILSLLPNSKKEIISDAVWCKWLEDCASGRIPCNDIKLKSYCRLTLLNILCSESPNTRKASDEYPDSESEYKRNCPQFGDALFLLNPELPLEVHVDNSGFGILRVSRDNCKEDGGIGGSGSETVNSVDDAEAASKSVPLMDVVFVHGLRGGPFNSWRIADDKSSTTKAGLVESIDEDAGKEGTCWPREWLAADFPQARFFTVKYKTQTNLTQWTGASLPLQEVSSMLLRKLVAAGIGSRPVIFVTHSMGGLVVKQLLYQAKLNNYDKFLNNTIGLVCIFMC